MLLITDVVAVTMDQRRRVITNAAIAVDAGRIEAVDKVAELSRRYPTAEQLAGAGMLALPGLIDAHAHADQSLLRGRTDDLGWIPFLDDWITPYLVGRRPEAAVAAYRLAMLEMIHSGTTCFVSPNVDPGDDLEVLISAIDVLGLRAVLAHWVSSPESLSQAAAAVGRWNGAADGRIEMRFGLDIPRLEGDRYQEALYPAVAQTAGQLGSGLVYHFCSEVEDWTYYEDHFQLRPTEWAESRGILGPQTLLINGCWLTPVEVRILAETGTPVVHSPSANMKMASGVAPVRDLRDAGVTVALGTDGAANNNSYDLIREMKAACLLQNSTRRRFGTLTAEQALEMATIDGAKAIGRADDLGSLEPGKRADLVLVDLARAHTWPVSDPIANLVYAAHGGNVDTVLIDGRVVMRHGRLDGVDEGAILEEAAAAARDLGDLCRPRPSRWPSE